MPGQLNPTVPYSFWGARLTHTKEATAVITNGAGTRELGRCSLPKNGGTDGFILPSGIPTTGLEATVSAGVLNVYVD